MDFDTLKARVRFNLNRADQAAVVAEEAYWVNAECRRWHERAPILGAGGRPSGLRHNWSFLIAAYDFATVASTASYALPTDFLRPIRLVFTLTSGTTSTPVRSTLGRLPYLYEKWLGADEGAPSEGTSEWALDRNAGLFYVFAVPDDAYTGRLYYLLKYADLANGADTNDFTVEYWDGIVAGATARGYAALKRHEDGKEYRTEAEAALQEAIGADKEGEGEEDVTLPISTDVFGTAQEPRPLAPTADDLPPLEE